MQKLCTKKTGFFVRIYLQDRYFFHIIAVDFGKEELQACGFY